MPSLGVHIPVLDGDRVYGLNLKVELLAVVADKVLKGARRKVTDRDEINCFPCLALYGSGRPLVLARGFLWRSLGWRAYWNRDFVGIQPPLPSDHR